MLDGGMELDGGVDQVQGGGGFIWHGGGEQSRVTKSCQLADSTSVGARPPGGSQPCASLSPLDIPDFQLCNEQRLPFSRV